MSDKERAPQKSDNPRGFDKFIELLKALGGGAGIVALGGGILALLAYIVSFIVRSCAPIPSLPPPNGSIAQPTTPITTSPTSSTARVAIIEPSDNTFFDARQDEIEVKVRIFSRSENEDLWIVSNPAAGKADWQPACNLADRLCSTPLEDGVFSSKYWIKNQKSIHYIYVMSADKSANLAFKNYLSRAQATHEWSGMALPGGTTQLAQVKITVE